MKAVCAPLLLLLSLTAGAVEPVQIKIRDLATNNRPSSPSRPSLASCSAWECRSRPARSV